MKASRKRETKETSIDVTLETNGANNIKVETGIELLDEILKAFAKGSGFDLTVKASGDLETGDHHTLRIWASLWVALYPRSLKAV